MADSFNNPPQPTPSRAPDPQLFPTDSSSHAQENDNGDNTYVPRPKRIACVVCRRRKLKCDGKRPSCGTCSRLGHECAYDEVRKKSGPKRGYVKQLEARLAQVETLLKGNDQPTVQSTPMQYQGNSFSQVQNGPGPAPAMPENPFPSEMDSSTPPYSETTAQPQTNETYLPTEFDWNSAEWNMISLGLEEPLPAQDVIDELEQDYFTKCHPTMPIIHRPRYFAAMNLAPHARPPIALRYIMWCHAAAISDRYVGLHPHFYQRARKYADMEEMKGQGGNVVNLAYCQTWLLIAMYEYRLIILARAWLSAGKAIRLGLMLGLNRLDGAGLDVKLCFPHPKDWTEKEERRRVFWMCFCADRYASVGTGWPLMFDERDIMTNLPASEESFIKGRPQETSRLSDLMSGEGISTLSSFGGVVLLSCFFGRELLHLHRPDPEDNESDLNGGFWKRHRSYDNLLLHSALSAPNHLRLPTGIADPNVIFWNMGIHSATICLHKAAIFTAEKNKLPNPIIMESKRRCIVAADQVTSIMRMISHMDLSTMNPFMSFCVFVAGSVFVQYLKSRPDDTAVQSSLEFIVSALKAFTLKSPLSKSFLEQLSFDISGIELQKAGNPLGVDLSDRISLFKTHCEQEAIQCSPLFNIRKSQTCGYVFENPSHGANPTNSSSASRQPHAAHGASSLPNRQKRTAMQQPSPNTTSMGSDMPSFNNSPNNQPGGARAMEMDFSSEFSVSDKISPPSDHPTPSTLNSSSNTSYSMQRTDNSSPQRTQQQPFLNNNSQDSFPSLGSVNQMNMAPETTAPNQFDDISSLASQLFASNPETQFSSSAADLPFSMSPSWNSGGTQAPNSSNTGASPGGLGSFDEAQWAQLLNGANWGNWGT